MVTDTGTTGARTPSERTARTQGESISASAENFASQAQGKMSGLLRGQMEAGADYVHMVTETAHSFANDLQGKAPELARIMHRAADRADRFADDFRHRSPDEIFNVASDYARRNPRLFFGGAIALGFVLSRFMKSGSDHGSDLGNRYSSSSPEGAMSESGLTSRREFGEGSGGSPARGSVQARGEIPREDFSNAR